MLSALLTALVLLLITFCCVWRREQAHHTRLTRVQGRLDAILDSTEEIIHIKDPQGRYLYANQKTCEFFGLPAGSLMARHNRELLTDADTIAAIERDEHQVLDFGQRVVTHRQLRSHATGREYIYQTVKVPLRNAAGRIEAICTLMTDVTKRLQAEERAHKLTFYDTLTDLPNVNFLTRRLTQAIQMASAGGENGALLIVNLNNFKKINDTQGFESGNWVLREVAQRLINGTRARDTVSRINADVFAILMPQLGAHVEGSAHKATELARSLTEKLTASPLPIGVHPYVLKVSMGITLLHAATASADAALREADIAMHLARERNSSNPVFYEQALQRELEHRLWLEQDLARALGTDQLQIHLQPQYAQDGQTAGVELLARWNHPEQGAISPEVFIPLVEKVGIMCEFTDWVLVQACHVLNESARRGQSYLVSVNIHPKCLTEPDFPARIQGALEHAHAPGSRLILEVTEGTWLRDYAAAAKCMSEVCELGVRFSVDDFGTGYSNLACLKRLPLFELKIDKSLVQDLPYDQDAGAIASMTLSMARQLGMHTVAEGVETRAQADFLRSQHCDALQGFLLDRPMPIADWLGRTA
jgi:diguanylate cyclase (GGDEF)-like protein/PAS domain S-box-containing protein